MVNLYILNRLYPNGEGDSSDKVLIDSSVLQNCDESLNIILLLDEDIKKRPNKYFKLCFSSNPPHYFLSQRLISNLCVFNPNVVLKVTTLIKTVFDR